MSLYTNPDVDFQTRRRRRRPTVRYFPTLRENFNATLKQLATNNFRTRCDKYKHITYRYPIWWQYKQYNLYSYKLLKLLITQMHNIGIIWHFQKWGPSPLTPLPPMDPRLVNGMRRIRTSVTRTICRAAAGGAAIVI